MDPSSIKDLVERENMDALCALVDQTMSSQQESDRETLSDAIYEVLNIWLFDFYCKKGGDPSKSSFLQGLEAVEKLESDDLTELRASFLMVCADYFRDLGNLDEAKNYVRQCDDLLRNALSQDPESTSLQKALITLNNDFPPSDAEFEARFIESLDLAKKMTEHTEEAFGTLCHLVYQSTAPASLKNRLVAERDWFSSTSRKKAIANPVFALAMIREHQFLLALDNIPERVRLEKDLIYFLETAAFGLRKGNWNYGRAEAGHLFSKAGEELGREDFLLFAEWLFQQALSQPNAFSLLSVYIAQAKEKRAILIEKMNPAAAQVLRSEIRKSYLDHWGQYRNDVSYLSHATEYLLSQIVEGQPHDPELINEIYAMALASEKAGQGHYSFPYDHLFLINLLRDQEDEACLWLGRGYYRLHIFISPDKLNQHLATAQNFGSKKAIGFLEKIIAHNQALPANRVDKDEASYETIQKLTLPDIEAWLTP